MLPNYEFEQRRVGEWLPKCVASFLVIRKFTFWENITVGVEEGEGTSAGSDELHVSGSIGDKAKLLTHATGLCRWTFDSTTRKTNSLVGRDMRLRRETRQEATPLACLRAAAIDPRLFHTPHDNKKLMDELTVEWRMEQGVVVVVGKGVCTCGLRAGEEEKEE
uniref:Uncharacterized protein n=1 Tax=Mesocestoides corti TaxID=53468 RepID=A0A5K3FKX0_MESCO